MKTISLEKAKEIFIDEIRFDILNNGYVDFEKWLIEKDYTLEEWKIEAEDNKMKEDYLRS